MSRKIKKINFDDIDFSDYQQEIEELNKECEELLNDPKIKKLIKKEKKISKIRKIADFLEMGIEYGFWEVITGKVKREYIELESFNSDNDD